MLVRFQVFSDDFSSVHYRTIQNIVEGESLGEFGKLDDLPKFPS